MDRTPVHNFTKLEAIEVSSHSDYDARIGAIVSLTQRAGSNYFQFSMRPAQARFLAKALMQHADHLDDME